MNARIDVLRDRLNEIEELIQEGEKQLNWLLSQGFVRWADGVFNDLLVLERRRDRIAAQL